MVYRFKDVSIIEMISKKDYLLRNPMQAYVLLFFAVIAEIIGTSALKASYGFTKLLPTLLLLGAYFLAFWLLSISLKTLPVAVVYAIWSGLGIIGITIVGIVYFKEEFGIWHFLGTLLIVIGVVVLTIITESKR